MRVALYARVSSEKQAENDLSIASQLKALAKHASDRGWTVQQEYIDEAESARSANRPQFQEMIAAAKKRAFDAILVWKFSRFARNREDSILYKALLGRSGINVISVNEQVDPSPSGKLLEGIIESIDEFYSSNLAQDTLRGMKEKAGRGFLNGGNVPIGYKAKKVKDGGNERTTLEPDETKASLVKHMFELCMQGLGTREIAKQLNSEGYTTARGKPWGKNTVHYVLTNEVYTGTLVWNKKGKSNGRPRPKDPGEVLRIQDSHPAIVDRATFKSVQRLLEARSPKFTHPRTVSSEYLLSGFMFCGKCGAKMGGRAANSSGYHYYACNSSLRCGKTACSTRPLSRAKLEPFVIDQLRDEVLTEENLKELVRLTNEEIRLAKESSSEQLQALQADLEDRRRRLDRLYDALETGRLGLEDLAPRIKQLTGEIAALDEKLRAVEDGSDNVDNVSEALVAAFASDLQGLLARGSVAERRSFLRSFIKRIEVQGRNLTLDYTMPLQTRKAEPPYREVLPFVQSGSPDRTRTTDLQRGCRSQRGSCRRDRRSPSARREPFSPHWGEDESNRDGSADPAASVLAAGRPDPAHHPPTMGEQFSGRLPPPTTPGRL